MQKLQILPITGSIASSYKSKSGWQICAAGNAKFHVKVVVTNPDIRFAELNVTGSLSYLFYYLI